MVEFNRYNTFYIHDGGEVETTSTFQSKKWALKFICGMMGCTCGMATMCGKVEFGGEYQIHKSYYSEFVKVVYPEEYEEVQDDYEKLQALYNKTGKMIVKIIEAN